MVVPNSVPEVCLSKGAFFSTRIHETFPMISTVVISIKFSIEQCLNYLSSMHSLSKSVK